MDSATALSLAIVIISLLAFFASFLLQDLAGEKPARFAFRLFFACVMLIYLLTALQSSHQNPIANLAAILCLATLSTSLLLGIFWRCRTSLPEYAIYGLAVAYCILQFVAGLENYLVAFLYNLACSMLAVYCLWQRKPLSNPADKGLALVLGLWSLALTVSLIQLLRLQLNDVSGQTDDVIDYTVIYSVAALTGLCILLIGSYLLDTRAELERQASHDPLTGLYNRRFFSQESSRLLSAANRHQSSISLILCNIDHFKHINEHYGNDAGDQAIRAFAGALQKALRNDDMLCRYDSDEFIALLPQTDLHNANRVAERMRGDTEQIQIADPQGDFHYTASFGVCQISDYADIEAGIKLADIALYTAKELGRNRVEIFRPAN